MDNTYADYGDLKIICAEDCGNAPKKNLLKELSIAFAKNDIGFISEVMSDHVCWDIIGYKVIQGKNNVIETLEQMKDRKVTEIQIRNIITHGRTAAVNGTLKSADMKEIAFCDVYLFTGAGKKSKIKEITSYVIETS